MIKKENYTLTGTGGRGMMMDITFNTAHKTAPLIIFVHGFKGFKDWGAYHLMGDYFVQHGFRFLKFNFSHNGVIADNPREVTDMIAFSENTFSMEVDELNSVVDFACNGSSLPKTDHVFLIGHSMGGAMSIIHTATDKRIKKLVTMAAISGFRNLWKPEAEEQWKLQGMMYVENKRTGVNMPLKVSLLDDLNRNPRRLDVLAKAAQITQPWLIIHGDNDTSVGLAQAEELKAANPHAHLFVVKGADHVFNASHPYPNAQMPPVLEEFCEQAVKFFAK